MRRLANQTRDDTYTSNRDYQTTYQRIGQLIEPSGRALLRLVMRGSAEEGESGLVGAGGFLQTSGEAAVKARLYADGESSAVTLSLGPVWKRFGLLVLAPTAREFTLHIECPPGADLRVWGINGSRLTLPDSVHPNLQELAKTHLAPETFYLDHDIALALDICSEGSSSFSVRSGPRIVVKKCSYCERMLPLNMDRLGSLSFHKHNAKVTKHQNECRSCKKWRINNAFNPLRTTDQLHESSVITREHSLFLREPEILRRVKSRTGAGLKSQVWNRFGRKCFYCERPLTVDEVHLDHTRPMAYLWPIDEHATCLCADHNNLKKDKFPVDFYTEMQLGRLSEITGLPLDDLRIRDVNDDELQRIVSDLPTFAREWDARTFAATARKIAEVRPQLNLFARLSAADPQAHRDLLNQLGRRPPSVGG